MANRHERRRTAAAQAKVVMLTPAMATEILARGRMCAWDGCQNTYSGSTMPGDWRCVFIFWEPEKPIQRIDDIPPLTWDRDGVLCPVHARQIDGLMKSTGRELLKPSAGRA
jgi:hypothetical protein